MLSSPRAIGYLLILAFLAVAAVWIWNTAGNSELIKIERQNNDAGNLSDRARSDYDLCLDRGGVWSNVTRKCSGP